jgi:hypothetical protein
MKKILLILVLALFSSTGIAAEKDYKLCSIAGFLAGNGDHFELNIAMTLSMQRNGSENDPICTAAHTSAYKVARRVIRTSTVNKEEVIVMRQAGDFKKKIHEAIISIMNYR